MSKKSNIIVALDFNKASDALKFCENINPEDVRVKIGKELFTAEGPSIVKEMQKLNFDVFLDLKFHDIPNTTAKAIKVMADLGVWMCNVHALGGSNLMDASVKALAAYGKDAPLLIAVTLLTSIDEQQAKTLQFPNILEYTKYLAKLSSEHGLDGVVCSAVESKEIKAVTTDNFLTITPGIRLANNNVVNDDQSRIVTPAQAIQLKSDYLVIGRPITQAKDPQQTIQDIIQSLN